MKVMEQRRPPPITTRGCKEQRMLGQSYERVFWQQQLKTKRLYLMRGATSVNQKLVSVVVLTVDLQSAFASLVLFQGTPNITFFITLKF